VAAHGFQYVCIGKPHIPQVPVPIAAKESLASPVMASPLQFLHLYYSNNVIITISDNTSRDLDLLKNPDRYLSSNCSYVQYQWTLSLGNLYSTGSWLSILKVGISRSHVLGRLADRLAALFSCSQEAFHRGAEHDAQVDPNLDFLVFRTTRWSKRLLCRSKQAGIGSGTDVQPPSPTLGLTSQLAGERIRSNRPGHYSTPLRHVYGTAGQQLLRVGGSGTSSSPITVKLRLMLSSRRPIGLRKAQ